MLATDVLDLIERQQYHYRVKKNKPEFMNQNPIAIKEYLHKKNNILYNSRIYNTMGDLKLTEIIDLDKYIQQDVFIYNCVVNLPVGSYFGELGLLKNQARSATIICSEDTDLGIIQRKDYMELLANEELQWQKLQK